METKIAVIGGGSVNWMPTLMRDVYMMEGVDGGEIRLIDPDTERAEAGIEADRSKLLQALSLDPLCQTIDFNMHEAMADDLIKATRKWLPRWK